MARGIWVAVGVAGWLAATALGQGASAAEGAAETAAPEAPADANVIIYRAYAEPIWPATLLVDDRKVVTMGNKAYTALKLEPGGHRIRLAWNLLTGGVDLPIDLVVERGTTHYVEVVGDASVKGSTFEVVNGFRIVPAEAGARRVAVCCRYHAPKASADSGAPPKATAHKQAPEASPPADANLFVFDAAAGVGSATIVVDGRKLAKVPPQSYAALRLAPGPHKVQLTYGLPWTKWREPLDVTIKDGDPQYLEIVLADIQGPDGPAVKGGFMRVNAQAAAAEIRRCCRYHPTGPDGR